MCSNGRWLRATVLSEEEEEGCGGIYRKNSTGGLLYLHITEPPVYRLCKSINTSGSHKKTACVNALFA